MRSRRRVSLGRTAGIGDRTSFFRAEFVDTLSWLLIYLIFAEKRDDESSREVEHGLRVCLIKRAYSMVKVITMRFEVA
jgi:hypothetical protein